MKTQRNTFQMKNRTKPQQDLSEMEISNAPDRKFKVMIIKTLTGLEKRMEDISETLTTEIKELKKNQSEMKDAINKVGNRVDTINSRLEEAGE